MDWYCLDGICCLYRSSIASRYFWSYSGAYWPQWLQSLYTIGSKPIFILGIIITILPSCLGITHSFFNLILNVKVFTWIARISFCTYLVHLIVIQHFLSSRFYDVYYNITDLWVIYFSLLLSSLFFGFVTTMTIEVPFSNMLKLLFSGLKKR